MDRLYPLVLVLLWGCDGDSAPSTPPPSRVDAVKPAAKQELDLANFCEEQYSAAEAPVFSWPTLDGATPAKTDGWTWVNLWATWCGPCVEEMPMLAQWKPKLAAEGAPVEITFVSVDAKAEDVERFKTTHPSLPTGVRVKNFADVAPWLSGMKLDAGSAIPIQIFVDKDQKIRCVREGSVGSADYPYVKKLLSGH